MDGLNDFRAERVAGITGDLQTTLFTIADVPTDPPNPDDYQTEGWAALRQCALDCQDIINRGMVWIEIQASGGPDEQAKLELNHILLDSFARRHEARKILYRQAAAQRWVLHREQVLQGQRPNSLHRRPLRACDEQLRNELSQITDESVYQEMQSLDLAAGRWTAEDPSLREVRCWLRVRSRAI
ncbi:hypothetical protein GGR56DRAFT_676964 [Xylariaceae sp. FL0804]|nr:hypothetical protein GGR56DRAFT_676964 [Xylariaceae sp. FL0804]